MSRTELAQVQPAVRVAAAVAPGRLGVGVREVSMLPRAPWRSLCWSLSKACRVSMILTSSGSVTAKGLLSRDIGVIPAESFSHLCRPLSESYPGTGSAAQGRFSWSLSRRQNGLVPSRNVARAWATPHQFR
jgi:hypothetical protein